MTRAFIRHGLEVVVVLLAGVLAACGGLAWKLSQGPISLDMFRSDFERALAQAFDGDVVSIGAAQMRWSGRDRAVFIELREVAVARTGGELIASAPRLEAGLQASALFRGRVAYSRLVAQGGAFYVVRDESGVVSAGLGTPEATVEHVDASRPARTPATGGLRTALNRLPPVAARLREFRLEQADLYIRDARTGFDLHARRAAVTLLRDDEGLEARAVGTIETGEGPGRLSITARSGPALERGLVRFELHDVPPAVLFPEANALALLSGFDAPVSARGAVALNSGGRISAADLNLDVSEGELTVGGRTEPVHFMSARASYEPQNAALRIEEASFAIGESSATVAGVVMGAGALIAGVFDEAMPFDLDISDMSLDTAGVFEAPLVAARIHAAGHLSLADLAARFDTLDAEILGMNAALHGEASLERASNGRLLPAVRLEGPVIGEADYSEILRFWPVELADGARDYVARSVLAGRISNAHIDLDLPVEALVARRLDNERLTITFDFDDADVAIVSTMSPIRQGRGRGVLYGNSFQLEMDSGRLLGVALTDGFVDIPRLSPKGATARFGMTGRGDARDIVAYIDEPPLEFPSQFGVSAEDISGTGTIDVVVTRPMRVDVDPDRIGFTISGDFDNVSAPTSVESLPLSETTVHIEVDTDGIVATGAGLLGPAPAEIEWREAFNTGGAPSTTFEVTAQVDARVLDRLGAPSREFLNGAVGVHMRSLGEGMNVVSADIEADLEQSEITIPGVAWSKPAGAPGAARLSVSRGEDGALLISDVALDVDGLEFAGSAEFADTGRLIEARLDRLHLEDALDVAGTIARGVDGGLLVNLAGDNADARGAIVSLVRGAGLGGGEGFGAPIVLTATLSNARVTDDISLSDVVLNFDHDGQRIRSLDFSAGAPNGALSAEIALTETGARRLHAHADDAGLAMRMLLGFEQIDGGALTLDGNLPPLDAPAGSPVEATLEIDNFRLLQAPAFAQMLSLPSLRGLADSLAGEGITFDRLQAPLSIYEGRLAIDDGRAAGPALGVTAFGEVNLIDRELDVEGVLVPAYTFNSFLGGLPVLGDLLVSREGEGVFALTYSLEGPFSETLVFVNPLSALTPGILRRIFEGTSVAPVEQVDEGDENTSAN